MLVGVFGGCLGGVWRILGSVFGDVWGCFVSFTVVWAMFGGSLESFKVVGACLGDVWGCLGGVWGMFGGCWGV